MRESIKPEGKHRAILAQSSRMNVPTRHLHHGLGKVNSLRFGYLFLCGRNYGPELPKAVPSPRPTTPEHINREAVLAPGSDGPNHGPLFFRRRLHRSRFALLRSALCRQWLPHPVGNGQAIAAMQAVRLASGCAAQALQALRWAFLALTVGGPRKRLSQVEKRDGSGPAYVIKLSIALLTVFATPKRQDEAGEAEDQGVGAAALHIGDARSSDTRISCWHQEKFHGTSLSPRVVMPVCRPVCCCPSSSASILLATINIDC